MPDNLASAGRRSLFTDVAIMDADGNLFCRRRTGRDRGARRPGDDRLPQHAGQNGRDHHRWAGCIPGISAYSTNAAICSCATACVKSSSPEDLTSIRAKSKPCCRNTPASPNAPSSESPMTIGAKRCMLRSKLSRTPARSGRNHGFRQARARIGQDAEGRARVCIDAKKSGREGLENEPARQNLNDENWRVWG